VNGIGVPPLSGFVQQRFGAASAKPSLVPLSGTNSRRLKALCPRLPRHFE